MACSGHGDRLWPDLQINSNPIKCKILQNTVKIYHLLMQPSPTTWYYLTTCLAEDASTVAHLIQVASLLLEKISLGSDTTWPTHQDVSICFQSFCGFSVNSAAVARAVGCRCCLGQPIQCSNPIVPSSWSLLIWAVVWQLRLKQHLLKPPWDCQWIQREGNMKVWVWFESQVYNSIIVHTITPFHVWQPKDRKWRKSQSSVC